MSDTIKPSDVNDKLYQEVTKFLDKVAEPKLRVLLEHLNKILEPKGVRVGMEVQWFIKSRSDNNETKTEKSAK